MFSSQLADKLDNHFQGMAFHNNALFMVPFDHVLQAIYFDTQNRDYLEVYGCILALYTPIHGFHGPFFKSIGQFYYHGRSDADLFDDMVQVIEQEGLPYINRAHTIKELHWLAWEIDYNHGYPDPYLERVQLYSAVLLPKKHDWVHRHFRTLEELLNPIRKLPMPKTVPPIRDWESEMLGETRYLRNLFERGVTKASAHLMKIEKQSIQTLGLQSFRPDLFSPDDGCKV